MLGHAQPPQSSVWPQPSGIDPQLTPAAAHVLGAQPQTLAVPPPPQICGAAQDPQSSVAPQPSEMTPQPARLAAHVVFTHGPAPHTLGTPAPPQLSAPEHVPLHTTRPPQPSEIVPQFLPLAAHVVGEQPHTPTGPPPPHWLGWAHEPQLTATPQPLSTAPQFLPS